MTKRRMIDPSFWQSESMSRLTTDQRFLFIGLFSNADDQGRLKGHPALIRNAVYPFDNPDLAKIQADLDAVEAAGSITQYCVDGRALIQINGWWDYQAPSWAYPSEIPAPEGWSDRLRYRKNDKVCKQNWAGAGGFGQDGSSSDDDEPPQPAATDGEQGPEPTGKDAEKDDITTDDLGKALPKALGKATEIEIGLEIGLEIEPKEESLGVACPREAPQRGSPPSLGPLTLKFLEICQQDFDFVSSMPKLKRQMTATLRLLVKKKADVTALVDFERWRSRYHWTRGSPPTMAQVGEFWGDYENWIRAGKPEKVTTDNGDQRRHRKGERAVDGDQAPESARDRGSPGSAARAAAVASRSR